MNTTAQTTQDFINRNREGIVNITPEVQYSIKDVIRRDKRLQNGKYEEAYFPDGDEKPFMRMIWILARSAKQNTDFDTRNFDAVARNTESVPRVGLFKLGLRNYMNYSGYANFLNSSGDKLIDDGHVILKKCDDGKPKEVDLLRIVRPAHISNFDAGIAEEVNYTFNDILAYRDNISDEDWETIEALEDKYQEGESTQFVVWEYYKWEDFLGKRTITCTLSLDTKGSTPTDPNPDGGLFIELDKFETPFFEEIESKAELKKLRKSGIAQGNKKPTFPYVEKALFKIEGRWKGMGYYELLAAHQEVYNTTWLQKIRHDEQRRNGTLIYKKSSSDKDTMLTREWLDNIDTGGIFPIWNDEDVSSLKMESMTGEFILSLDKIFEIARLLSGVTPQRSGEDVSQSTATGVLRDEKVAESTFAYIKERKELMYKELFEKFEFDSIRDDMTEEDAVALLGDRDELIKILKPFVVERIRTGFKDAQLTPEGRRILEQLSNFGPEIPPEVENSLVTELTSQLLAGDTVFAAFMKDMFKDIKLRMQFFSYEENFNKDFELKQLQETINTLVSLPNSKLSVDNIIRKKLELLNNRITGIEKSEEEIAEDQRRAMLEAGVTNQQIAQ